MVKKNVMLFLMLSLLSLSACKGVDAENYDKLKVGMEYATVTSILGKPDTCKAVLNMKNCIWTDGEQEIRVKFVAEQVAFTASRGLVR